MVYQCNSAQFPSWMDMTQVVASGDRFGVEAHGGDLAGGPLSSPTATVPETPKKEQDMRDSPRSASKSTDTSLSTDSGPSDENDEERDDTYDEEEADDCEAWLRDFAGSFDPCEDDESEAGSDRGAEEEDDDNHFSCLDDPTKLVEAPVQQGGLSPPFSPASCGLAHGASGSVAGKENIFGKAAACSGQSCGSSTMGGVAPLVKKVVLLAEAAACSWTLGQQARTRPHAAEMRLSPNNSPSEVSPGAASSSATTLTATPQLGELGEGRTRLLCTRAVRDTRPPVEDDYDLCKAISEFADQRPGDRRRQQRDDMKAAMAQKREQVNHLEGKGNALVHGLPILPEVRAHYDRVRQELLKEIYEFETSLCDLEDADASENLAMDCRDEGAFSEDDVTMKFAQLSGPRHTLAEAAYAEDDR